MLKVTINTLQDFDVSTYKIKICGTDSQILIVVNKVCVDEWTEQKYNNQKTILHEIAVYV